MSKNTNMTEKNNRLNDIILINKVKFGSHHRMTSCSGKFYFIERDKMILRKKIYLNKTSENYIRILRRNQEQFSHFVQR